MKNSFRLNARLRNLRFVGLPPAESLVLLIFIAIATVTACFHEPWADEAQAWLIARNLGIPGILHQMGYEGSPPLWHLLLWLLTRLHLPYAALGLVSLTLVASGMYIWLRWSPLPAFVRLLLPFAFYYQYQYAVVSRSYALSTLLAFAAVALWRAKPPRILAFGFVLALLVQTNLYGCMIAAGIACAFACEFLGSFLKQRPSRTQILHAGAAGFLVLTSAAIAKFLAQPYADCSFRAARQFEKGTAFGSLTRALSGLPEFSAALGLNLTFFGIGGLRGPADPGAGLVRCGQAARLCSAVHLYRACHGLGLVQAVALRNGTHRISGLRVGGLASPPICPHWNGPRG